MLQHPSLLVYWKVATERVRGSAHQRQNTPCQDFIQYDDRDATTYVAVAVADGHGSSKSHKSDLGSELAVRISLEHLRKFARDFREDPFDRVNRFAHEELPRRLVKGWIDAVAVKEGGRTSTNLPGVLLEYGSTILSVLITHRYILYLQLGDGDILRVSADGHVARPIPSNPVLFANETTSLSMVDKRTGQPNGWLEMAVVVEPISSVQDAPALIVIATDGYANSFSSEKGFVKVGSDILEMVRVDGWTRVKQSLNAWLSEATNAGSGDDISVALLWNRQPESSQPKEE